jgi:hypothetical protein
MPISDRRRQFIKSYKILTLPQKPSPVRISGPAIQICDRRCESPTADWSGRAIRISGPQMRICPQMPNTGTGGANLRPAIGTHEAARAARRCASPVLVSHLRVRRPAANGRFASAGSSGRPGAQVARSAGPAPGRRCRRDADAGVDLRPAFPITGPEVSSSDRRSASANRRFTSSAGDPRPRIDEVNLRSQLDISGLGD